MSKCQECKGEGYTYQGGRFGNVGRKCYFCYGSGETPSKGSAMNDRERDGSRYRWRKNVWTGNYIADVDRNTRLVRILANDNAGTYTYLYEAQYWGDYSVDYPLCTGVYVSPNLALTALRRLRRKSHDE